MLSFRDALHLQNDLDNLCSWTKEWLLRFSASKCKHLQYGNASTYEYYMDEEGSRSKLTIVSSEKDLGVRITSKLILVYNVIKPLQKQCSPLV